MTPTPSVLVTIGLFALTFLSPGPNLLIVLYAVYTRAQRAFEYLAGAVLAGFAAKLVAEGLASP